MFFPENLIDKLDSIETDLGANVFEIRDSIAGNTDKIKGVHQLALYLRDSSQELSDQQSNQISRIFAVYAWALKIANQPRETVIKFLGLALQYAKPGETLGLYHYVNASIVRGYAEFLESETSARAALPYFENSPLNLGHTCNCLALALMRQGKLDQVEPYLNLASLILAPDGPLTKVEQVIGTAEGILKRRTDGNNAQFYEKTGRYSDALRLAEEVLAEKIAEGSDLEEVAYTQITLGEILNKLSRHDEALVVLTQSNVTYTQLHGNKPHANHLRVLIALAETSQMQNCSVADVASFLEPAATMTAGLKLSVDHDFSKRINALQQTLREQVSRRAGM